ncbi:MAG: 2-phospho-L-lactate guanylyltransferase [Acidimicrobiales bacterium]
MGGAAGVTGRATLGPHAVLVPVKAFEEAKVRLARALPGPERAELAREMARRVLAAAAPLPVAVVCDDAGVASWARSLGAVVVWEPGLGLNRAVEAGVARLAAAGVARVTVAHADLPLATDLSWVGVGAGRPGSLPVDAPLATLVPDRRLDGTNVASIPTSARFRFSYGPGSFLRHWAEAVRSGLAVEIVREPSLAWDIDLPDDLDDLVALVGSPLSRVPPLLPTDAP